MFYFKELFPSNSRVGHSTYVYRLFLCAFSKKLNGKKNSIFSINSIFSRNSSKKWLKLKFREFLAHPYIQHKVYDVNNNYVSIPTGANSSIVSPKLGVLAKTHVNLKKLSEILPKNWKYSRKNSMKFQKIQFLTTIRSCPKPTNA